MDDASVALHSKSSEINEMRDLNGELSQQLMLERQRADMSNAKVIETRNKLDLVNNQLQMIGATVASLQSKLAEEKQTVVKCREELEMERQRSLAAHNASISHKNEMAEILSDKRKMAAKIEQMEIQIRHLDRAKAETETRFRGAAETLTLHHEEEIAMLKKYVEEGSRRTLELENQKRDLSESYWRLNDRFKVTENALIESTKAQETLRLQSMETEETLINLRSEHTDVQEKYAKVRVQLEEMQSKTSSYKDDYMHMKEKLAIFESELRELKPQHEELQRENSSIVSQLSSQQMMFDAEKKALQGTIDILTQQLESIEDKTFAENEELKSQLATSKSIISDFEQQLSSALDKLDSKTAEVDKLKSDVNSLKQVTQDVGSKLSRFEMKKVTLEGQLEAANDEIQRLSNLHEGRKKESEMRVVRIQELEAAIQTMIPIHKFESEVENAIRSERKQWSETHKDHKEESELLLREIAEAKAELITLKSQLEKDRKRMNAMEEAVVNAENLKEATEKKLLILVESHSSATARLEAQKAELALQAKAIREELDETKKIFKQSKLAWESQNVDVSAYKKEAAELRESVDKFRNEKERLKEIHAIELEHSKENYSRLINENEELKHNIRDAMKTAAEQVAQFEIQNRKLKESLEEAQRDSATIMNEVHKRKTASTDLVFEIERLREDRENLTQQVKKLSNDVGVWKQQHGTLNEAKNELQVQLRDRTNEVEKVKREVKNISLQSEELHNKLSGLEQHKRKTADLLQSERDEKDALKLAVTTLKDKITSLEEELGNLNSQKLAMENHLRDRNSRANEELELMRVQLKKAMSKAGQAETSIIESSSKLQALNDAANNTIAELMKRLKASEETRIKEVSSLQAELKKLEERITVIKNTTNVGQVGVAKGKTVGEIAEMLTLSMQKSTQLEEENRELKETTVEQEKELQQLERELKEAISANATRKVPSPVPVPVTAKAASPHPSSRASSGRPGSVNNEAEWLSVAADFPGSVGVGVYTSDDEEESSGLVVEIPSTKGDSSVSPEGKPETLSPPLNTASLTSSKMESTINKVEAYLDRAKKRDISFEDRVARMAKMGLSIDGGAATNDATVSSSPSTGVPDSEVNVNSTSSPVNLPIKGKSTKYISAETSPYAKSQYAPRDKLPPSSIKPPLMPAGTNRTKDGKRFLPSIL
jgi:chromosome segregation ATPase